jgi:hypothetical protein
MTHWRKSPISSTRGLLYRGARLLGWVQAVEDAAEGHPNRAVRKLANKVIGREIGSRIYFR